MRWEKKVCFDCLLSRQHFCEKLLQSNSVYQDYSKSKVGRLFETQCITFRLGPTLNTIVMTTVSKSFGYLVAFFLCWTLTLLYLTTGCSVSSAGMLPGTARLPNSEFPIAGSRVNRAEESGYAPINMYR